MNLIQQITKALSPKRRAVSLDTVIDTVFWDGPMMRLVDIFVGESGLFALFIDDSTLYRADVIIDQENRTVTLSEPVEIEVNLERSMSSVTVLRTASGAYRLLLRACTATLNRVGEIDSTELFDNMIARANDSGIYPAIDFIHLGERFPVFDMGQVDFLARDNLVYMASGTLDPEHPLTKHMVRSIEDNPEYWGCSIEYLVLRQETMDLPTPTEEGITLRVFNDGFNTRITICPEANAASHFTSIYQEHRMKTRALNDSQMAALAKLFGDDEDALSAFLDGNEEVNRAAEGMIHRITEDGDDTDVAIEDVTTEDVTVDSSIELDDEAIGMIARAFAEQTGIDGNVAETIVTMQTTINELKAQLNGMTERNSRMEARLKALESDEDDKRRIWQEDLSGKAATRVTYRPRQAHAEGDGEETSANIASRALANLP